MASKRTLLVLPALGVTVIAVAAGTGMLGGADDTADVALAGPPATATVQKRTLTRTEKVGGDLGFGDTTDVPAPLTGGGMVTWLPGDGDVLERGDTVYRLDQRRVPLLYGTIPLYRTLSAGSEGADVRQLERNLRALGYTGFTVDADYTSSTAAAVRDWQDDLGRTETGRVGLGDAVVSSGARRVAEVTTQTGAAASGVLLRWTGTTRVVTVDLDTDYADLVRDGVTATVELPDGATVPATVTDIGTPTSREKGGATLPVELAVAEQQRLGRYQVATVQVVLAAETREDVLAVPVTALVARPGGGYAVTTGGDYLPVTTGLFSGGYVEISGDGVTEGLPVGVPE
ncbi:peptidoglycan-binding protein [Actinoplanes flavus]|uniref:Peptidoglycan-binding protein n=1 Tax=Actinoplanes flavus TaxID=2820290 RepID=A0ABS3UFM7_9ACTN|nr:peptidoglycan-binding protein [Actinoplanes flavus]MBO3737564.1 peptidoglycan-binding protein [Actinoplanes flavus]